MVIHCWINIFCYQGIIALYVISFGCARMCIVIVSRFPVIGFGVFCEDVIYVLAHHMLKVCYIALLFPSTTHGTTYRLFNDFVHLSEINK